MRRLKFFLIALPYGDWNISIAIERGVSYVFGKPSFQKHMTHYWRLSKTYDKPPFPNNKKYLIAIGQWRSFRWRSNFFGRHSTHPPLSYGNWKYLVVKTDVGMCYHFGKQPMVSFSGDRKILVSFWWWGRVRWWWKKIGHPSHNDRGNQKKSVTTKS